MAIMIRLGTSVDIDVAASVYERSNLVFHRGDWPTRIEAIVRVKAHLREPASWFLLAFDGPALVGMISAQPLRANDGAGAVISGGCFLSYLYVAPDRWGAGIGG